MNRREFMAQLERLLDELPISERSEALRFYNDYFEEAGPENEAQVIRDLGSPGRVAAVIRANLDGNQDGGEFTERGYRDRVQETAANYPGPVKAASEARTGSRIFGNRGSLGGNGERQYDGGRGSGSGRGYAAEGQEPSGGQSQGARSNGYTAYGNSADSHGTSENRSADYKTSGNSYGGYGAAGGCSCGSQVPRRKRGAGGWVLLIIILVFASPVLLGIGGGILGLVVGIASLLLGLLATCVGGGIGLTVGGVVLFAESIPRLFHSPASGLVGMGGGLIFTALGILLLLAFAWLAFRLLPRMFRAVMNFISRVAHRGRGGNAV